jgi:hypothetical protein
MLLEKQQMFSLRSNVREGTHVLLLPIKKLLYKHLQLFLLPLKSDNSNIMLSCVISEAFILIQIVGGGVQLGPLGTAATTRPIVPTPGDYEDGKIGGMMIGRGNRSTRRKPAPVPLCPPQTPHAARTRTRAAAVGSQQLNA